MGVGAIIVLVVMAVLTLMRTNRFLGEDDAGGGVATGVLFALEVGILVLGNPWIWAAFVLLGTTKLIFWPSPEAAMIAARSPPWVHNLNIVVSVVLSGTLFWLFQWLR